MHTATPLISVIIPAFNAEKYLPFALDSLLKQSYPNFEVIVIDDGSTDQTSLIAQNHPIKPIYHFQPNRGVAVARNEGVLRARGDYIAFLDSDDLYLPHKLASQCAYLQSYPKVDVVICMLQRINDNLDPFEAPVKPFVMGAMLIRRNVFERVGLFDPEFIQSEDTDWFLRAKGGGISFVHQAELGLLYRQHANNLTRDQAENKKYFWKAMRNSTERRAESKFSSQPSG